VVDLIELFFPKSIDKLFKEGAERTGLTPLILMPVDDKLLSTFFKGADKSQDAGTSKTDFGCSQVIIVRN
jgi:hypothetical protein